MRLHSPRSVKFITAISFLPLSPPHPPSHATQASPSSAASRSAHHSFPPPSSAENDQRDAAFSRSRPAAKISSAEDWGLRPQRFVARLSLNSGSDGDWKSCSTAWVAAGEGGDGRSLAGVEQSGACISVNCWGHAFGELVGEGAAGRDEVRAPTLGLTPGRADPDIGAVPVSSWPKPKMALLLPRQTRGTNDELHLPSPTLPSVPTVLPLTTSHHSTVHHSSDANSSSVEEEEEREESGEEEMAQEKQRKAGHEQVLVTFASSSTPGVSGSERL